MFLKHRIARGSARKKALKKPAKKQPATTEAHPKRSPKKKSDGKPFGGLQRKLVTGLRMEVDPRGQEGGALVTLSADKNVLLIFRFGSAGIPCNGQSVTVCSAMLDLLKQAQTNG